MPFTFSLKPITYHLNSLGVQKYEYNKYKHLSENMTNTENTLHITK